MSYNVVMPQLGMTMTEGSVLRWLKGPGDRVEKGEPLFEVQTDKVEMEVEAPCSGVLSEILAPVEQVIPVGSPVAVIADTGGDADVQRSSSQPAGALAPAAASRTDVQSGAVQQRHPEPAPRSGAGDDKRISPRARRFAAERGISLADLTTWKNKGRIVEADVRSYVARQPALTAPASSAQSASVRQAIARRMTESFRDVPHFYLSALVDASELSKLRAQLLPVVLEHTGARLSYLDLIIRASALALVRCPDVNAFWDGEKAVRRDEIHVGFAAQFDDRLLTPVLRDVAALSIPELARTRAGLVEKGRSARLSAADIEDATFTVSNLGPFGVDQFQAIIVPPQSAILAVGRIAPRATAVDGRLGIRDTVWVTLSVDHRILDGAVAARFLSELVSLIEAPYRLLIADTVTPL
jgi:pyruvate dehydrogenase E2 component (dihydrolipoamide acetyltransferase)